MSQPFDLDALVLEEEAEPFRFTWGGKQFSLPPIIGLPVDRQIAVVDAVATIDKADATQLLGVVRLIVGDEMLKELSATKGSGGQVMSTLRLMRLIGAWMNAQGATPGKSPDSSESSASTAPPLKRTSRSGRARRTN